MKLLSQVTKVVDTLKRILDDYDYLEYKESKSKNEDFLHVEVIREKPDSAEIDKKCIKKDLELVTGIYFSFSGPVGPFVSGVGDLNKNWSSFRIRERRKP